MQFIDVLFTWLKWKLHYYVVPDGATRGTNFSVAAFGDTLSFCLPSFHINIPHPELVICSISMYINILMFCNRRESGLLRVSEAVYCTWGQLYMESSPCRYEALVIYISPTIRTYEMNPEFDFWNKYQISVIRDPGIWRLERFIDY